MEWHIYSALLKCLSMCTHESVSKVHALKQLLRVIIKTIQAGGDGGGDADVEFKMECWNSFNN